MEVFIHSYERMETDTADWKTITRYELSRLKLASYMNQLERTLLVKIDPLRYEVRESFSQSAVFPVRNSSWFIARLHCTCADRLRRFFKFHYS